jgi:hypothetical protein
LAAAIIGSMVGVKYAARTMPRPGRRPLTHAERDGDGDRNGRTGIDQVVDRHLPEDGIVEQALVVAEADEFRRPARGAAREHALPQRRHRGQEGEGGEQDDGRGEQHPAVERHAPAVEAVDVGHGQLPYEDPPPLSLPGLSRQSMITDIGLTGTGSDHGCPQRVRA